MDFSSLNPTGYKQQLEEKRQRLTALFSEYSSQEIEVFESLPSHYRMRAEFRVWHEGEDLYFYMFDKVLDKKVRTDQYMPASVLINEMMLSLMEQLRPNATLRHKLFQVDFLSTLSGEILVSLLYHKKLDDVWKEEATKLKEELSLKYKMNLIGRARKQKIDLEKDYVIEKLELTSGSLFYKQIENSFTQPNANVAIKMLEWAIDVTRNSKGDLLELYCGNGNFSIALASNFKKVLATELAAPSVMAAQYNIDKNKIKNVEVVRMSAEDFSDAMNGVREFQRLRGIDLKSYECSTVFVDPPRAGLDANTLSMVSAFEKILYISCNPNTLIENMEILSKTHKLKRIALFDQFPYTDHMECGVLLERI